MKSTVPVGTGEASACLRRAGQGPRLRVLPRVPQGGHGRQGLPGARPRRHRRRRGLGGRRGGGLRRSSAVVRTDVKSAEMVKLAWTRSWRRSLLVNEIANVCEETGDDIVEVARRGMGLDDRIGRWPAARISFSSCLLADQVVLAQLAGQARLVSVRAGFGSLIDGGGRMPFSGEDPRGPLWVNRARGSPSTWRSHAGAPALTPATWSRCGRRSGRRVRTTADQPFVRRATAWGEEILTLKARAGRWTAQRLAAAGDRAATALFAPDWSRILSILRRAPARS